ncbi:tetratricopeptide repeat protein [Nocardioides salsibiostraticola]
MTQQPFSRPGAIDLSALKRPPTPPAGAPGPGAGASGGATAGAAYSVTVTEQNFQEIIESSMTAPVLLAFFSRARMPESAQMAEDLATLSGEFGGNFLAGLIDIDDSPQIAQAVQVPSVPYVVAVLDGRPAPLLQDVVPIDELRTALTQVMQQLATQGMNGRHQPRGAAPVEDADQEPEADPRYAAAQEALAANDIEGAVAEYQKLVTANPADGEAVAGLAMAKMLHRTQGADLNAAREAAAADPDDVGKQTLVADLDLLGGHVEDAFVRLIELVRRTSDADRTAAREHLLSLFAAVGNEDPRVLKARQGLASALF